MLDDELRALTSVEPSPEFRARVRAAVASTGRTTHAPWWRPLAVLATACIVTSIVWLTAVTWRTEPASHVAAGSRVHPSDNVTAPRHIPPPDAHNAQDDRDITRASGAPRARTTRPRQPREHSPSTATARGISAEPTRSRVQIDPREAAALRQLFTTPLAVTVVEPTAVPATSGSQSAIVIPELSIAPLEIEALEGDDDEP
jgi:hypothetical protein